MQPFLLITYLIINYIFWPYLIYQTLLKSQNTPTFYGTPILPQISKHIIISKANVFAKLNPDISTNPNENYDILEKIIIHNINKHFPRRQVKFNKYKHKKNTWITKGILHSINFRDNLYRELKKACPNSDIYSTIKVNLRTYNKILKRNILLAKQMHYKTKLDKYKNDIKGTWGVI